MFEKGGDSIWKKKKLNDYYVLVGEALYPGPEDN
jgi:hypothetical protein